MREFFINFLNSFNYALKNASSPLDCKISESKLAQKRVDSVDSEKFANSESTESERQNNPAHSAKSALDSVNPHTESKITESIQFTESTQPSTPKMPTQPTAHSESSARASQHTNSESAQFASHANAHPAQQENSESTARTESTKSTSTALSVLKSLANLIIQEIKIIYEFFDNQFVYAASLSFYSIFALIPVLLIGFSVMLNIPDFQSIIFQLKEELLSNILPSNSEAISGYIDTFLENGSKLGVMGFAYAFIASILFFRNFDEIASKIFNSQKRKFMDSIVTYWTMITLLPLSLGASIYFSAEVQRQAHGMVDLSLFFEILPYFFTWLMFFLLFKIAANKPIPFMNTFVISLLTSAVWLVIKWGFVYYALYNQAYKSIYGQISILLFLMLWIYITWIVILCGMRLSEGISSNFGKLYDRDL